MPAESTRHAVGLVQHPGHLRPGDDDLGPAAGEATPPGRGIPDVLPCLLYASYPPWIQPLALARVRLPSRLSPSPAQGMLSGYLGARSHESRADRAADAAAMPAMTLPAVKTSEESWGMTILGACTGERDAGELRSRLSVTWSTLRFRMKRLMRYGPR